MPIHADTFFLTIQNKNIEVQRIGSDTSKPTIVFLHEGLGSMALWRDFPSQVAGATNCPAIVYSRYGYGNSDVSRAPRPVSYLHDEALICLPELLEKLAVRNPILLGHSDGGSIALIYAGEHDQVKGLILLAPHLFVEEISIASIVAVKAAFETTDLREKLGLYHRDSGSTFRGWNDIWLNPDFRSWNIEGYLPNVKCPVLAIQGLDDQYGTLAQLDAIARQAQGPVELVHLPNCGHSPHRDQSETVLAAIRTFVARLTATTEPNH